ncbi:REP element-mobilizing transposase RayT [Shimia gijangensis]|uniref:REP element-mobilizing transposase RayT n=1 Tax=Shimia gijangensis TaxID=1470563 RepID=A0A1M6SFP2_9RHOB|nr:REP element-mobilizing transposase RayT [Shimia gijangensis]
MPSPRGIELVQPNRAKRLTSISLRGEAFSLFPPLKVTFKTPEFRPFSEIPIFPRTDLTTSSSAHTRFYHRFHVVWVTNYRDKVLQGGMRERIREIIRQTCAEMGVHIVRGVLARDHVHMFLSIPPKLSLSDVMQHIKGRSSRRIQREFPELRKRYWGRRFCARGYFSTISFLVAPIPDHAFLSSRSSSVCSATTSFRSRASRRSSLTSSVVAARAVSPASRFFPASMKSLDHL